MAAKLCIEVEVPHQHTVKLFQERKNSFTVQYGEMVKGNLTYAKAAAAFGESVMHALSCNGEIKHS